MPVTLVPRTWAGASLAYNQLRLTLMRPYRKYKLKKIFLRDFPIPVVLLWKLGEQHQWALSYVPCVWPWAQQHKSKEQWLIPTEAAFWILRLWVLLVTHSLTGQELPEPMEQLQRQSSRKMLMRPRTSLFSSFLAHKAHTAKHPVGTTLRASTVICRDGEDCHH